MSADALPLALLILFVEMTVGGLWSLLYQQYRNNAVASFIKFCATTVFIVAAITFVLANAITIDDDVDGFPVDTDLVDPARWALAALFVVSALYAYATVRDHRVPALVLGTIGSVIGFAAIAMLAHVFSIPTWGYPLTLASFLIGAVVVGAVSNGMILGHWYLVTPRLPEAPLREMTLILFVALLVQAAFLVVALVLPRDTIVSSIDTPILENMFLWLRIGLGLIFPAALAWMAYDSSGVRAMQSATGLLYIAMVLVICGEVVGKGLLFVSAVPN